MDCPKCGKALINHRCLGCGLIDSGNEFFKARNRSAKQAGKRTKRRRLSKARRTRILTRDDWTCQNSECSSPNLRLLSDNQISIDHINPLVLGGENSDDNYQSLCYICDKEKGTRIINYREDKCQNKALKSPPMQPQ